MTIVTRRGVHHLQLVLRTAEENDNKEVVRISEATLQAVKGSYTSSEQLGELLLGLKTLLPKLDDRFPSTYSEESRKLIVDIETLFRNSNRSFGHR